MQNIDNILDCEQSIFFFRFSEGGARVRKRASSGEATAREKRGRQPKERKETLLIVYGRSYIIKFEVPFLVLPQNKSWNDIQEHKISKLNFKTRVEA